jgi:hypothetical protein
MKNRNFFMFTLFADSSLFKFNFENTKRFYVATKRTFTPIFKPFIQMEIDIAISHIFHVLSFLKFRTVFE